MNMNIHINRQVEEADGCWPVTFALPNISTEGKLCPGSTTQAACCKVELLSLCAKDTACIAALFSSPKLSRYH